MKRQDYIKQYNDSHKAEHHEYYLQHKEERREYMKQYREKHKEELKLKKQEQYLKKKQTYFFDKKYRAKSLVDSYKYNDVKYQRGICTLTTEFLLDNIFNSKCIYCGEDDWAKLGCDRIDNTKPHTPDNVVCSCWDCNNERGVMSFEKFKNKKGIK